MHISEAIYRAQEKLLKAKGSQNIITLGYRLRSHDGIPGKRGSGRLGITNYFVNTIVTALQSPQWEVLFQRIGIDAMLHLLTEACVFVSLPNDCLCQMTGDPIINLKPIRTLDTCLSPLKHMQNHDKGLLRHLKRKIDGEDVSGRASKRMKPLERSRRSEGAKSASGANTEDRSPADIMLLRSTMYHARPIRLAHTNNFVVGLPLQHILNRLNPPSVCEPKASPETYSDPSPRKLSDDARHLAKYVFPRQFGLSSVHRVHRQGGTFERYKPPNFTDREAEIKTHGPCKTPKRVKSSLPILERMIWKHSKCGYKPLRDKLCPSKAVRTGEKDIDSSVILEMLSEDSSQADLRTQRSYANLSIDSTGQRIQPDGLSQAERHTKHKPRFAEFACSYTEVYRFVVVVTKFVIPKAFWGSQANFKLVMRHVKEFIVSRRYESLSLHYILQGFSTAACDWLAPGVGVTKQTRVSVSDALKRRELLEEFLFWYFDSFVFHLLKTNFYITESSAFRNRLLYFRQDDWSIICKPLIDRLTETTFERISQSEADERLRQRQLGYSFVRLLPKETGVRPIVNLRSSKSSSLSALSGNDRSINQILQGAFQILTYEKKAHPGLLGASVFSSDEMHVKLQAFRRRLPKDPFGNMPKLYFVKVDVQACFDTIEQDKLLNILYELLSDEEYMIQRFGKISSVAGKIRRNFVKNGVLEDDHPHFLKYASDLASALRNTIFSDQVVYQPVKKANLLKLLEEHITENIVRIGPNYYKQMVGIPQGSVLSSILCCFFYGDMEKNRHQKFSEDPLSLLLRMVDDYLFVTTNLSAAKEFLGMMVQGHPEYGCFISKEKTLTNFDYDEQVMNVTEAKQRAFPWCGYTIDMKTLAVSVDYSRFYGTDLRNTLTVGRSRKPGTLFVQRMLRLAKSRSHIVYCDPEFHTQNGIYLNVYQNFLILAMKAHGYLCNWGLNTSLNTRFVLDAIEQMIRCTYSSVRSSLSATRTKGLDRSNGKAFTLQRVVINWLGFQAFHTVFSRKSRFRNSFVKNLKRELDRAQYRHFNTQFRQVLQEGLEGVFQIDF
ncbi:hypothetical protein HGRIS_004533 [Hohenbuehelia grisea]|uniref:Telomerase reverse transcriptase n=1 Tax=Hohenbuehelia grisea TaxID=104357 RepID=A0ABR3JC65_9AGAR